MRSARVVGELQTSTSWALTGLVATTLRARAEECNARLGMRVLESVFLSIWRDLVGDSGKRMRRMFGVGEFGP